MKQTLRRGLARTLRRSSPADSGIHPASPDLHRRARSPMPLKTLLSFTAAMLAVLVMTAVNYRNHHARMEAAEAVVHANAVTAQVQQVLSAIKDAETSQRGFLLTNAESYLEPYARATSELPSTFVTLKRLLGDDPAQMARLLQLEAAIQDKLAEMHETITLERAGQSAQALALVQTDRGKFSMDRVREMQAAIIETEQATAQRSRLEWSTITGQVMLVNYVSASILLLLIASAALSAANDYRRRSRESWLRQGQLAVANHLQGDPHLAQLGENALAAVAQLLGAQIGAFHVSEANGKFLRVAGYALSEADDANATLSNAGLVAQAAQNAKPLHVRDLPAHYLAVTSSLGQAQPRELLLVPAVLNGRVQSVLELGFFRHVTPADIELTDSLQHSIAMGVRAARDRSRLEELLEETRRQAEELQTQQEELRVSNEELEEQSRSLRESQQQLQNQQAELEQSNLQLEQLANELASQRDQLAGTQDVLAERADKLERASQYKSEFLANMSHELRTPLNSTLILAKLLSDNREGNLTAEQVRYAQTISSAGNDLLNLINDILDLTKIEAGKVDLDLHPVALDRFIAGLQQVFEPQATERWLALRIEREGDGIPPSIITDEQRCGQILKNLLSNALKFTATGEVVVRLAADSARRVLHIAVQDSGIGIAADKLGVIFDAFVQADGSTHRKYGGTGLGLAISRDLAHLLGGDIAVQSTAGRGSTFTLTLPWESVDPVALVRTPAPATPMLSPTPPRAPVHAPHPARAAAATAIDLDDDRRALKEGVRTILVVEDDVRFAAILKLIIHEAGFQCLLTHTAETGLEAARTYQPSAILLDMHLPDLSGLGVLDQLKRDPLTRHVPVHVVSVADYAHDALEMGAVGYILKPVDRDQLLEALRTLDARISQQVKHVLVVEDDLRQRESVQQLLAGDEVQITAVETAGAALEALRSQTFDCMVMDLSLPDMSGYELLDRMAKDDGAFPPVIVYTGRSLTREEESALHRFSRAIIIKGARSPERLLAEVTLFLHQIETRLPADRQRMLKQARNRESLLEGRRVLVVEDDVRNIFALSAVLEPKGMAVEIARNGREAVEALEATLAHGGKPPIDLVLMDIMMPEMDGYTAMRAIRQRTEFARLPIIALTAKAMRDDQEKCLAAGANDYIAKPLDVEKLMSLIRVWIRK
ncbi:MAG: Aerobic respiration control sensor protein ArcB [Paracidovorax wautersii]|uniref:Virulence sensor protein BvgS n=1 Tax=Paracidovorax wautersii TaxID=1177982 RepID=A0A7V8JRR1_9BURK|nr:MAG: Aerobic respiration control sensor protein ArcB [Paracidovorax wautersii]